MKTENNLQMNELNFLYELSTILADNDDFVIVAEKLNKLFNTKFGIKNVQIFIKEEQLILMKLFERFNNSQNGISYKELYSKYKNLSSDNLVFNDVILDLQQSGKEIENVIGKLAKKTQNIFYIPLYVNKDIIGFMQISFDRLIEGANEYAFCLLLKITAHQLSVAISTILLNYQMQTNIKFHSAMKNIAKFIESQYEFAYIVPLIGEMIDRFISEHLIYVFIKDEDGSYKLVWPSSCHDKQIYKLLDGIKKKSNYILSENGKIGVFPLLGEKDVLGAIVAYSNIEKLLDNEINYIRELSKQASITIQKAEMYAEVLKHAALDALTGLNNRRQFDVRLKQEIATAKRRGTPLCCIMIDVDYFKKINDTYGHIAGDCVLKGLAKLLCDQLREYDIASRYGGEEFCILLPATTLDEASLAAQRLRKATELHKFDVSEAKIPNVETLHITISLGVAQYSSDMVDSIDLYKKADSALYSAKKSGRNKVVVFKE